MLRRRALSAALAAVLLLPSCLAAGSVFAACTNPAGNESDVKYNGDYHTYQFCNGTSWLAFGGGSNCTATGNYSPTTPSGSGYFVMSGTTYNGNLGGLAGADALCLTELTTNTGWMGYSTANANGQLVVSKVHAFPVCLGSCSSLMPLTTYYFANAGNGAAGGASFTTDANGDGPYDAANWSAANYFSGNYSYWSNRRSASNTVWMDSTNFTVSCGSWNSSSSGSTGDAGNSSQTTSLRFHSFSTPTCDTTQHLICYVNP